jgi:hypothetical protein
MPIGCVATTYTFDAAFFEEECLARFAGLENTPREDGRAYLIEREEKLSQVSACVLVDASHVTPHRSLRWDLLPVRLAGGGAMHAKVSLLVWEHLIRVLVTSANLTEPGYRRNYEHLGVLDFAPQSDVPVRILRDVLSFLEALSALAPQQDESVDLGPQVSLKHLLRTVAARAATWGADDWPVSSPTVEFVPVIPGQQRLFGQLRTLFPARAGAKDAWIVSPFFDRREGSRQVVDALVDTMGVHGERTLSFYVAGRELSDPEKTVELDAPAALRTAWQPRLDHFFHLVRERDEVDEVRALHAKSLWLKRDGSALFVIGSSNFTRAGTGMVGRGGNIEANLAYVLPNAAHAFAKRCAETYPAADEIDLEDRVVNFLEQHEQTPDAEGHSPLPAAFGLALFRPMENTGVLMLSISDSAPQQFEITHPAMKVVLSSVTWIGDGRPETVEVSWDQPRPPSYLEVSWGDEGGEDLKGTWVVNVTDGARLPPPDELRSLGLEELLEILTSARPLHEVLGRIIRKREARKGNGETPGPELDPHKKVDTRSFLIRRMRRVAAALEGLRERLERPTFSQDALDWRLRGPVGPVALAKKLTESEPDAAAFMIAEVALTVHRTDWSRVESSIGRRHVRSQVRTVTGELRQLAKVAKAPPNLASYVREAFEEIDR